MAIRYAPRTGQGMTKRTIALPDERHRLLAVASAQMGISQAALIGKCIDAGLSIVFSTEDDR